LSVHFRQEKWVPIQRQYLDMHVDLPEHRIFAVNGLPTSLFLPTEITVNHEGNHAQGLNRLADLAMKQAKDSDWLLFLDSDAFPIAPLSRALPEDKDLVAVQRLENLGDLQPHPSFCAARVGLWRKLLPDWSRGHTWTNALGMDVTDVGAGVLHALDESGTPWEPLIRKNRVNYHPLWFGVYGFQREPALVYHHGAGSRARSARVDRLGKRPPTQIEKNRKTFLFFLKVALFAWRGGLKVSLSELKHRRRHFTEAMEQAVADQPKFWRALV